MIVTSAIIFYLVTENFDMSFIQTLFRRKLKKREHSPNETSLSKITENSPKCSKENTPKKSRRRRNELSEKLYKESIKSTSDSEDEVKHSEATSPEDDLQKKLQNKLNKLSRREENLRRRQEEAVALENEIKQVVQLIKIAKQKTDALKDDIINKKCELSFLSAEVPEDFEAEVKRRDPLYYKKYSTINSVTDASNLLVNVRHRIKALHYLELLAYEKYLDYQHNLKSATVRKRSIHLGKDRKRHFGHLSDALKLSKATTDESKAPTGQNSAETETANFTTVTIDTGQSTNQTTETTSQIATPSPPAPPLPLHLRVGPLSFINTTLLTPETFV